MRIVKYAAVAITLTTSAAVAAEDVVIVYDASGSMWGQIDGTSKIEIARDVMEDLVNGWSDGSTLGLVAYGHRRQGDCTDIETLIAPGPLDKASFINAVKAIKPVGKTPISASVQHAADLLSYRDNPATVILISDGLETCNADPCALSAQLAKQGVKFTAHVVGFDLTEEENASLSCIAENTGGVFVPASNATELKNALAQVQSAVDVQPVVAEPEPVPEPAAPEVALSGPAEVVRGANFTLGWTPTLDGNDYVTIVAMGAKEGESGTYIRVRDQSEGSLTAPADTGLYELRYVQNAGKKTLGAAPIEVIEAEVDVTGPASVTTGAAFDASWSANINPRDYITIVPVGTKEGESGTYIRVGEAETGSLIAPAETGLYELRYVLNEGSRTLASAPIEVVEAEIGIAGPATVTNGAAFDVTWSGSVNPRDYIAIVPAGAKEGASGTYVRVGEAETGSLTAPSETGLYELRYVLNEGSRTLASAPIEVVEAEIGIAGPATVTNGAAFDVTWSGSVNPRDYIAIVPAGAKEGASGTYVRVGEAENGSLTAPAETGLYELRYVLNEGSRTLASAPIEVVTAEVSVSGPATVRAGTSVDLTWSTSINPRDYIAIVAAGADEGSPGNYVPVGTDTKATLKAPAETGLYEIRYVLNVGNKTLASAPMEVVSADAPLDDGAGLSVPGTAKAGETISVSWTAAPSGTDQRISIARKDQPDFGWIAVWPIGDVQQMDVKMPDEPGLYEVRFLDIAGQQILGRSVIEVQ